MELTELSYRQLNDWEQRGLITKDSERGAGWRRFSPRDLFSLMICAEIRDHFGVPVERLRFVRDFMAQEGADHLQAACHLMATLGTEIWLITDLKHTFIMDSELEIHDMVEHGFLHANTPNAYIWIKVSPLVNRLLACLQEPVHLPSHGAGYRLLDELRQQFGARNTQEFEVLQLLRSGDYEKVEVMLADGAIRTIKTNAKLKEAEHKDLTELVRQHQYQTLTVTTRGGRVVSINQTIPRKMDK